MATRLLSPAVGVPPLEDPAVREAAEILREGGLVAFPTETVYGLGVRADDGAAVARLFAAKGRPSNNPVIVHGPSARAVSAWATQWTAGAARLAAAFWPGPLTLVVPAVAGISRNALAGGETVGLRVPRQPVAEALLALAGVPVAAPSANRSGCISPSTARHVLDSLDGAIDAVLDGGPCAIGIESTVLDISEDEAVVLRPGAVTPSQLARVLGRTVTYVAPTSSGAPLRSPGLLARHYAPALPMELVGRATARGNEVFAIRFEGAGLRLGERDATLPMDPGGAAASLYATLRHAEKSGASSIVCEAPPDGEAWDGLRDRLTRAAARG